MRSAAIKDNFPAIGSFGSADINDLFYSGGLMRMFLLSPLPSGDDLLTPCSPQSDGSCSCPRRETAPSPPPGHYVWYRKLVSVVSRILDNHGLVRQSGYQPTSDLDYLVRHYINKLSNQTKCV